MKSYLAKYYLAGPMAGYPEHNFPAFSEAANVLRLCGFDIVSAHEINHGETPETRGSKSHAEYMKADLKVLLECDGIILLEGWPRSKGAMIEFNTAVACGMDVLLYDSSPRNHGRLYHLA